MAQERQLKTGKVGVANTIYIPKPNDDLISKQAREKSKQEGRYISKSKLIVEAVVKEFPA